MHSRPSKVGQQEETAGVEGLLLQVYQLLFEAYGDQGWWPGETRLEIIVGAVLTQLVSWKNVKQAIANLKQARVLDVRALDACDLTRLKELIRPSGYYNRKAVTLKALIRLIAEEWGGDLDKVFATPLSELRERLLAVHGVGEETADSILLYAGNKLTFVVDEYTRRIFTRLGFLQGNEKYRQIQQFFMDNLPRDTQLYNQYHALIVKLGSTCCHKSTPKCHQCPLSCLCSGKERSDPIRCVAVKGSSTTLYTTGTMDRVRSKTTDVLYLEKIGFTFVCTYRLCRSSRTSQ